MEHQNTCFGLSWANHLAHGLVSLWGEHYQDYIGQFALQVFVKRLTPGPIRILW